MPQLALRPTSVPTAVSSLASSFVSVATGGRAGALLAAGAVLLAFSVLLASGARAAHTLPPGLLEPARTPDESRVAYGLATIAGRLVDESGRPLAGASVELRGRRADGGAPLALAFVDDHRASCADGRTRTDANGAFALHFVPRPGRAYALGVAADGHVAASWSWRAIEAADVLVLGDVVLPKGVRVRGQVVDRAGRALLGPWRVTLASHWSPPVAATGARPGPAWQRTTVDPATGTFEFTAVPVGKADLRLDARGLPFWDAPVVTIGAQGTRDLVLRYGGASVPSE